MWAAPQIGRVLKVSLEGGKHTPMKQQGICLTDKFIFVQKFNPHFPPSVFVGLKTKQRKAIIRTSFFMLQFGNTVVTNGWLDRLEIEKLI